MTDASPAMLSAVQMEALCPQSSQPESGTGDNRRKPIWRAGQVDSLWVSMNCGLPSVNHVVSTTARDASKWPCVCSEGEDSLEESTEELVWGGEEGVVGN